MFRSRKVPKKVGSDDGPDESHNDNSESPSVVTRPASSKVKKSSTLRTTFNVSDEDEERDNGGISAVKRAGASRGKGAVGRSKFSRIPSERLPLREVDRDDERPSYSADHLAELKSSTPTKPASPDPRETHIDSFAALDLSSKFGADALVRVETPSAIPSVAEIREKKERRRRLAKEQDYISLNDEGENDALDSDEEVDPRSRSLIIPAEEIDIPSKYGESRLVRDDEDFAEGFDEFVEDSGKVALGRAGMREQDRQRKTDLEAQIRAAQGGGASGEEDVDEGIDRDEVMGNAAYDEAQARSGTYGSRTIAARSQRKGKGNSLQQKLRTLPELGQDPEWETVMPQWEEISSQRSGLLQNGDHRLTENETEEQEGAEDSTRLQLLLKESAEKLQEALSGTIAAEKPIEPADYAGSSSSQENAGSVESVDGVEDETTTHDGRDELNSLRPPQGLGMAGMPNDEDDDDYY